MQVLYYSKTISFEGLPITFEIVPTQTVTSEHPFFDQIVKAVKDGPFEYTLLDRAEQVVDYRHYK